VEELGELGLPSIVPVPIMGVGSVVVSSVVVTRPDRDSGAVVEKSRSKLNAVVVDGAIVVEVAVVDEVEFTNEVAFVDSKSLSAARVDGA